MAAYDVIGVVPSSAISNGSTLTFIYPAPTIGGVVQTVAADDYVTEAGAVLFARALQNTYTQNVDFTLAYGEGSVVLTWINTSTTLPAADATTGTPTGGLHRQAVRLQLERRKNAILERNDKTPPYPSGDQAFFA